MSKNDKRFGTMLEIFWCALKEPITEKQKPLLSSFKKSNSMSALLIFACILYVASGVGNNALTTADKQTLLDLHNATRSNVNDDYGRGV